MYRITVGCQESPDADATRVYYDRLGEREWDRLSGELAGRVSFEVHRRLLARFIRPGDRVLEIGAGPGRFTLELASLGARVIVTDLSPIQLELNQTRVAATVAEDAVEDRVLLDVRDVGRFADGEFDAVVAYGGHCHMRSRTRSLLCAGCFGSRAPMGLSLLQ